MLPEHDGAPHEVVLPGKTQAPVVSQSVAPHAPVVGLHAAVQQWVPVPETPQTFELHWSFAVHALPAAPVETQVPEAPGFMQKAPGPSQSASEAQAVLHAVALAQTKPPGHAAVVPATQVLEGQVAAVVSIPPEHEAAAQSAAVLHWTQVLFVVSQTLPAAQSVLTLHATQVPVALQTLPPLSVQAAPRLASETPQLPALQVLDLHAVVCAVQSPGTLQPMHVLVVVSQTVGAVQSVFASQATHLPAPSQTLPLLSVHAVPLVASLVPQTLAVQVFVTQAVVWAMQSVGALHATQLPLPSQTLSPVPPVHVVPMAALPATQQPAVHVLVAQALVGVQSLAP
jgi:hypothetical protein